MFNKKILFISILFLFISNGFAQNPSFMNKTYKIITPKSKNISMQEKNNMTNIFSTKFDIGVNVMDFGCVSKLSKTKNIESKKLDAFFYSINHELWRTNQNLKDNVKEPSLNNMQGDLISACNKSMSQNISISFFIYQRAIKFNMKENRFFDIYDYIKKYDFSKKNI